MKRMVNQLFKILIGLIMLFSVKYSVYATSYTCNEGDEYYTGGTCKHYTGEYICPKGYSKRNDGLCTTPIQAKCPGNYKVENGKCVYRYTTDAKSNGNYYCNKTMGSTTTQNGRSCVSVSPEKPKYTCPAGTRQYDAYTCYVKGTKEYKIYGAKIVNEKDTSSTSKPTTSSSSTSTNNSNTSSNNPSYTTKGEVKEIKQVTITCPRNFNVDEEKSKIIGIKISGAKLKDAKVSSNNKKIATVTKKIMTENKKKKYYIQVQGKKTGKTKVKIKVGGKTKSCDVTVNKKGTQTEAENDAENIVNKGISDITDSINDTVSDTNDATTNESTDVTKLTCPKSITVKKGKTAKINCQIPSGKKATYKSKKTSVATVNKTSGKVTGKKKGTAKIEVKISNKEKKTVKVKVESKASKNNSTKKTTNYSCKKELTVKKGKTAKIGCKIPKGEKVTYKTENSKVATVSSSGKVTGVKKGSATITITVSGDKLSSDNGWTWEDFEEIKVKVKVTETKSNKKKVKAEKIKITNCPSKGIKINESKTLKKKITPSKTSNKNVTWKSNKENIVKVDNNGKIIGLSNGSAKVIVSTEDGSNKKASCIVKVKKEVKVTKNTKHPTSMVVSENSKTISVGEKSKIKIVWTPSDATKTVSWKSKNKKIATVNSKGEITGVKEGITTIVVTSSINNTLRQEVKVEVIKSVKPTSIKISDYNNLIKKGETKKLGAIISPSDATNIGVTWKSSNKKIATISSNGVITGKKSGQVTITATSKQDKSVKKSVIVVVTDKDDSFLAIKKKTIAEKSTYNIKGRINSEEKEQAVYSSSNQKVAIVDENGIITGIKKGNAQISVTIDGKTEKCKITVEEQKANGIVLDYKDVKLIIGQSLEVEATILPDKLNDNKVTWKSSNKNVATVNNNGKITAVKKGSTKISAKTSNGKKATINITVISKKDNDKEIVNTKIPTNLIMVPEEVILGIGGKYKLKVKDKNAVDFEVENVYYKTNNPNVVTVNSDGIVTAVSKGTAIVTAISKENKYITATSKVIVQEEPIRIQSFMINNVINIMKGESTNAEIVFVPENTTNQNILYNIENKEIATVDANGNITGLNVGQTVLRTVSEENNNLIAETVLNITDRILPASITLNKTNEKINVGKTVTLKATVLPENAVNRSIIYSSSDKTVATVDSKGKVTGKKKGTATITVKTKEGDISAVCTITVVSSDSETNSKKSSRNYVGTKIWPVKNLTLYSKSTGEKTTGKVVSAQSQLKILENKNSRFKVKYNNKTGWIDRSWVMIDMITFDTRLEYPMPNASNPIYWLKDSNGNKNIITNKKLYKSKICALMYDTAVMLSKAQDKASKSGYTLVVYDAYRPHDVTKYLYNAAYSMVGNGNSYNYPLGNLLAKNYSSHNFGIAIDLTLKKNGRELEMPTEMHYIGTNAGNTNSNSEKLASIMTSVGFSELKSNGVLLEWWHFQNNNSKNYNPNERYSSNFNSNI